MADNEEWYTEDETEELVGDLDKFREFIYGWPDAAKHNATGVYYKKKFVDLFANR